MSSHGGCGFRQVRHIAVLDNCLVLIRSHQASVDFKLSSFHGGNDFGQTTVPPASFVGMQEAEHDATTSGPFPNVLAEEWDWGRPGSAEDRELLSKAP